MADRKIALAKDLIASSDIPFGNPTLLESLLNFGYADVLLGKNNQDLIENGSELKDLISLYFEPDNFEGPRPVKVLYEAEYPRKTEVLAAINKLAQGDFVFRIVRQENFNFYRYLSSKGVIFRFGVFHCLDLADKHYRTVVGQDSRAPYFDSQDMQKLKELFVFAIEQMHADPNAQRLRGESKSANTPLDELMYMMPSPVINSPATSGQPTSRESSFAVANALDQLMEQPALKYLIQKGGKSTRELR